MKLKLVRIRSYFQDGKWTGADHIYFTDSHVEAISRFRKEYKEHDNCTVMAETMEGDVNDKEFMDFVNSFNRCGCFH